MIWSALKAFSIIFLHKNVISYGLNLQESIKSDLVEGFLSESLVDEVSNSERPSPPYFDHVEIHWFAPFLSGGGYSSEAMAFAGVFDMLDCVTSIEARAKAQTAKRSGQNPYVPKNAYNLPFSVSFQISHHGDSPNQAHIDGLTERDRLLIEAHLALPNQSPGGLDGRTISDDELDKPQSVELAGGNIILGGGSSRKKRVLQIIVCHSEPGAWHAPKPHYYTQRCPPQDNTRKAQTKRKRDKGKFEIVFSQFRIGRTMFETDRIPSGWPSRLNFMNEVWVPTEFSRNIFVAASVESKRLRVVSEPVDTDFYHPIDYAALNAGGEREVDRQILGRLPTTLRALSPYTDTGATIFLFVGKWEARKGIRMLIRAFYSFLNGLDQKEQDSALLVILTSAYHSTNKFEREIQKILAEDGLATKIDSERSKQYILLTEIPKAHMPHLYSAATALVIPSTGEGWGRPHVEAMACGTPVIATSWSGPTAYLTEENGYPLRVKRMQDAVGWEGHHWAEPDEMHLVQLLKDVHNDKQHYKGVDTESLLCKKGKKAREDMVRSFSLPVFAEQLASEIRRIERIAAENSQEKELIESLDEENNWDDEL